MTRIVLLRSSTKLKWPTLGGYLCDHEIREWLCVNGGEKSYLGKEFVSPLLSEKKKKKKNLNQDLVDLISIEIWYHSQLIRTILNPIKELYFGQQDYFLQF